MKRYIVSHEPFCTLAGVTFPNSKEDGSMHRQDILKTIHDRHMPVIVTLKHCLFENEPAIKVYTQEKQLAGWIPKRLVPACGQMKQMVLLVGYSGKTYHGTLYRSQKPTAKMYAIIHDMYEKNKIQKIPAYDSILYSYEIYRHTNAKIHKM